MMQAIKEYNDRRRIDNFKNMSIQAQKDLPSTTAAATALSGATTVAEQREAGLRRVRSD
jgi:hypothetical protein